MHFAHFSVRVFLFLQYRGPFPGPQVLVYCLFDAFNTLYHEDGISVLGTDRSQKEPYQESMGMRKNFKSTFSRSSHSGQGRFPIRAEHRDVRESVFLASFLQFPGV